MIMKEICPPGFNFKVTASDISLKSLMVGQQGFYGDLTWLRADKWPAIKETGKNPVVVHYTAGEKPWHKDCKHPLKAEYDNYMHLHTVLLEKKMPGHRWYFYVIEGIIDKLRSIYQWYRSKNGMVVNKA